MKDSCVPAPFWLNGWKHHMGFLCSELASLPVGEINLQSFCKKLKSMGSSVSDLYTGSLSPSTIAGQIGTQLKAIGKFEYLPYQNWIQLSPGKYCEISLSDKSKWTLLTGNEPDFYLHLHPSRYSENTIRVKANLLKSAVAMLAFEKINPVSLQNKSDFELINQLRKQFLDLSPVNGKNITGIVTLAGKLRDRSLTGGNHPLK
ncbi:MAG TPA: hypothetical protein VLH61_05515 [Bacteroidales bacterium]|nr:hypothetical protein [Bacteroidales bacterium]